MKIIGIMTGNSLDGCDLVLTEFNKQGMRDLFCFSRPIDSKLQKDILIIKEEIKTKKISACDLSSNQFFIQVHNRYIHWIASCIDEFILDTNIKRDEIDLVGFHGQTLDHNPPSVVGDAKMATTLQMGSGKMLAHLVNIPVVYDFRSDDIFNCGEGAPLMPPHNAHIVDSLGLKDAFFYNAGNTSNLALVVAGKVLQGFDAGPFNEFTDKLVRRYKNISYDKDAFYAKQGSLQPELLRKLFYQSVRTKQNENYLEIKPPKSADPSLYFLDELIQIQSETDFVNTLHTLVYFSAYTAVYALKHIDVVFNYPNTFVLFGGGWNNPLALDSFLNLLDGKGYELLEHKEIFNQIRNRFTQEIKVLFPENAQYMEARLVADMAYFYELKKAWTTPSLTGCAQPCVLGRKAFPEQNLDVVDDYISRAGVPLL